MNYVWLAALTLICVVGVVLTVFRLPGTWVIFAAAVGFSWREAWVEPSWAFLLALGIMALAGEAIEFATSALATRRAGASRRAAWGALGGGFIGMFVFSIPLPVIGTILGAALGCFVGAMIAEMSVQDNLHHGARVGAFAAAGSVIGTVIKTMIAVVMAGVAISAVLFF